MADFVGTDLSKGVSGQMSSAVQSGGGDLAQHGEGPWWLQAVGGLIRRIFPGAAEALKPATDQSRQLLATAVDKAKRVLDGHIESFVSGHEAAWERLDLSVRAAGEAQMMVVALSVTLLHLALRSLAYDEDRVERVNISGGEQGFPKLKIRDEHFRLALREIWGRFSNSTRKTLDQRYRYFYRQRRASPTEQATFYWMSGYAGQTLTNEFAYGSPADTEWLQFVYDLAHGDIEDARQFIARIRS